VVAYLVHARVLLVAGLYREARGLDQDLDYQVQMDRVELQAVFPVSRSTRQIAG